jgi:general L-amino acid transport system permease protein
MTTLTDPSRESFRLSMLIYDSRYRSMTIQIVALIGFLTLIGWLISNTAQNLADLGKEPSFSFLTEPAGYDINQQPVEYNSQDTHLRAAFIGVLNTLIVAFLGCIAATVIGVLVGILRLSHNWIVSRLMAVYVETFRNVPVLLWILFIFAILTDLFPAPRDFKGENPAATMDLFGTVATTNRGLYVPAPLFENSLGSLHVLGDSSFRFDIGLNFIAVAALLVASLLISKLIGDRASRIQEATGVRPVVWYWRLTVVVLPTVLLLWYLGLHFEYPTIERFNFEGGIFFRKSLFALWLALSLYTAAFIAEIVRAGILAISKGQTEAAAAVGLRPRRIMSLVILPQALRVIIPPLISNYLNLTKNSSLAIAVGYMDITGTLMGITLNQTGRELETILIGMLIYLTISLSISAVMNWYNESVKLRER